MKAYLKSGFILVLLLGGLGSLCAQNQSIALWPDSPLGNEELLDEEKWDRGREVLNVMRPDLKAFLPVHSEGMVPAIIVCPGGGYTKLCMEKEGYKVARWLAEQGIAAFVLKYRLNRDEALEDAQRAVSLLRSEAETFGIAVSKIGIMGFSAGAHLAANLAVNFDTPSSRPDFWIGVYGVYGGIFPERTKDPQERHIPPAFLVHAGNDSKVPVRESLDVYHRLQEMGVPAELHVYEQGNHGFALDKERGNAVASTVEAWSTRTLEWLRLRKIL